MNQGGHLVSKKHRIERDSDNDTHDDHDHHDDHDDHNHGDKEVEAKQDDTHGDQNDHDDHSDHSDHDDHDHDHGSTNKKTWTTAQKWGYATLANTFLGKNHITLALVGKLLL